MNGNHGQMKTGIKIVGLVAVFAVLMSIFLFVYPYARSYTEIETYDKRAKLPLKGDPSIFASSGNWVEDYRRMVASNFMLLGISDYNASQIGSRTALTLATMIGAQIVIIEPKYADADTDPLPFHPQLRRSGDDNRGGGPANNVGPAHIPAHIPDAISTSDYGAQFWARAKLPVFGANFSNFDMADARVAGTDEGVKVYVIIRNSPAFDGNVIINDLITHVDGDPVRSVQDFMNIIERNAGNEITLSVIRKNEKLSLPIELNDIH